MASTLVCVVFEFPARVIQQSLLHLFLKVVSDLVVSVIPEWNNQILICAIPLVETFLKSHYQFVTPSPNSLFNCHSPKGIKYELRLGLGLSHFREHKFKHSFQDTLNPFCDCGCEIETTAHNPLHCPQFSTERNTLSTKSKALILLY